MALLFASFLRSISVSLVSCKTFLSPPSRYLLLSMSNEMTFYLLHSIFLSLSLDRNNIPRLQRKMKSSGLAVPFLWHMKIVSPSLLPLWIWIGLRFIGQEEEIEAECNKEVRRGKPRVDRAIVVASVN